LDKISPKIKSLASDSSKKDRPTLILILHILIPPIQNNSSTYSSLPSLFYKSISLSPTPRFKKSTVEIEEDDNVDSDVEMQSLSPQ